MQKYEREIVELLERLEAEEVRSTQTARRDHPPSLPRRRPPVRRSWSLPRFRITPGHWMLLGLAIVLLSQWLLRGTLQQWVAIAGAVVFLWPVFRALTGHGYGRDEKTWRGRSYVEEPRSWGELRDQAVDPIRRLRRRFRRH